MDSLNFRLLQLLYLGFKLAFLVHKKVLQVTYRLCLLLTNFFLYTDFIDFLNILRY